MNHVSNLISDLIVCLCILLGDYVSVIIYEIKRLFISKLGPSPFCVQDYLAEITPFVILALTIVYSLSFITHLTIGSRLLSPVMISIVSRLTELLLLSHKGDTFTIKHWKLLICIVFCWFSSAAYLLDWGDEYLNFPFPTIAGFIIGIIVGNMFEFAIACKP